MLDARMKNRFRSLVMIMKVPKGRGLCHTDNLEMSFYADSSTEISLVIESQLYSILMLKFDRKDNNKIG